VSFPSSAPDRSLRFLRRAVSLALAEAVSFRNSSKHRFHFRCFHFCLRFQSFVHDNFKASDFSRPSHAGAVPADDAASVHWAEAGIYAR
jgi:hypothetical protein